MKGKKGLILILVLLLVGGLATWQLFFKKKSKKKAPEPKAPVEAPVEGSPEPSPTLSPSPEPSQTPSPEADEPQVQADDLPTDVSPPGILPPGAKPPEAPGIPAAQPGSAESQALISIEVGEGMKIAEGSTFFVEGVRINYSGEKKLQYQWNLRRGNPEKIEIQGKNEAQPRITLGNLEAKEEFLLEVQATDGLTEASEVFKITAFPAQLKWIKQVGGAIGGVVHMGDKWVAAQSQSFQIFAPDMSPLTELRTGFPIRNFFAMEAGDGKGALFAQEPQGTWVVFQYDPVEGQIQRRLPTMGQKIRRVIPFQLEGQPYIFALLERSIELWNLNIPQKPKLKSSITTQLKNPQHLAFQGRHLFVADEETIEIIEFSTGRPVASIPSGGSVTSLSTYALGNKNYLLSSIGQDRSEKNRQDHGLRIYEIAANGHLGQEKRLTIEKGLPIERAKVIPGVERALLAMAGPQGMALGIFDLKSEKLLPLNFSKAPNFLALTDFVTGKIQDQAVAVLADGNQIRVYAFKATGLSYSAEEIKSIPGIMNAAWVQAQGEGGMVSVGDEGSAAGGAYTQVEGAQLKVLENYNTPAHFPLAGAWWGGVGALLNVVEDPSKLPAGEPEAYLSFLSGDQAAPKKLSPKLGLKNEKGEIRPLGLDIWQGEAGAKVAVAIARVAGAQGGAGVALWQSSGPEENLTQLLGTGLSQEMELISLLDARDVALTPDGKGALVASGNQGVILLDLAEKTPLSRMNLGSEDWLADRVLVAHSGQMVLSSFIQASTGQVIIKIFGIAKEGVMTEWGTLTGLKAFESAEGLRAPKMALTEDDLYLFVPLGGKTLSVMNLSNPAKPFEITSKELEGTIRSVSLAGKFKDIFVALGPEGVAKLEFGF